MPTPASYYEQCVSSPLDPLCAMYALLKSAADAKRYVVYEQKDEYSLALLPVYELTVSCQVVRDTTGFESSWTTPDALLDCVRARLASIPIAHWRVYGTASFELAALAHGIELQPDPTPVLSLFVPALEVRWQVGRVWVRALSEDVLHRTVERLAGLDRDLSAQDAHAMQAALDAAGVVEEAVRDPDSERAYLARVQAALDGIRAGHFQKVIASRTVRLPMMVDLLATYVVGRRMNSPARSFLVFDGDCGAAGFSPETVVEVSSERVASTQLLTGTCALGADESDNLRLSEQPLRDPNELDEHVMSVRLAADELSRVCRTSSVCVSEFMNVVCRGTPQHLASRVIGQLADSQDVWSAFMTVFPAVTATGIPKREAVAWIHAHEPLRGLYSGAIVVLEQSGMFDSALVLRTVFQQSGETWLRAGAGIVAQSTPARKYEETCQKLASVARAVVPA